MNRRHVWKHTGADDNGGYATCVNCDRIRRTQVKPGVFRDKYIVKYASRLAGPWSDKAGWCGAAKARDA